MKNFFICRAVNRADGSVSAPVESTETKEQAESLFYTRCSLACSAVASGESKSEAVIWFDKTGFIIDHKGWMVNEKPEPEE